MSGRAYVAGFVLIENGKLLKDLSLSSPDDSAGPNALSVLYEQAYDFFDQNKASVVALCPSGLVTASKTAVNAHRAEGTILAAAGANNKPVEEVSRQRMGNAAGLGKNAKTLESVKALCKQSDTFPKYVETQRAAAAALCSDTS